MANATTTTQNKAIIRPGFHYTTKAITTAQKQSDYKIHPSRQSLCFDSKLVLVVVVIGLMEVRLEGGFPVMAKITHILAVNICRQFFFVINTAASTRCLVENFQLICCSQRINARSQYNYNGGSRIEDVIFYTMLI